MNRIIFFLIVILVGCSESECIWNEKENVGYIDYSTLPVDKLSSEDRILLKNMDFQGGRYICVLTKEDALAKGISEKRYHYFLKYLENQNVIIAEYIKDGATVTFGNKTFGLEGEFIEDVAPEFGTSANLLSRSVNSFQAAKGIVIPGTSNNVFSFEAFSQLSISGIGKEMSHWTVFLIEPYKGLRKILSGTSSMSTTVYVQTASSDTFVDWDWKGECVDLTMASLTLAVNSNIRGVELTFNTSKDWNYGSAIFNSVLPSYISVRFNKNLLYIEAKDQSPEGVNFLYYVEVYDNLSKILWYGGELQYGHPINNTPAPGEREITIYLFYARYDSELGKYVASQLIAQQEFYVPKEEW